MGIYQRLATLLALLVMMFSVGVGPATAQTAGVGPATDQPADPRLCRDVRLTCYYFDPVTGNIVYLNERAGAKSGVPVGVTIYCTVEVLNPDLLEKPVTFKSSNPWLAIADVSGDGILKVGKTITTITWPDSYRYLSFTAEIPESNLVRGTARGRLMTLRVSVEGGRCAAVLELFGLRVAS